MSLFAKGDLKMAYKSLRSTRWRSLLTMLGVIIGVASVVTIVSIGEGIKHQVVGQVSRLGKDLITVRPGNISAQSANSAFNAIGGLSSNSQISSLTSQDLQTIKSTSGVQFAVPLSVVPASVQLGSKTYKDAVVIATTSDIPNVLNQSFEYGDIFDDSQNAVNSAVLGKNISNQLFQGNVPLGASFNIASRQFIVRGQFSQFDFVPLSLDADFNNAIFIPYSVAQQIKNNLPVYEVLVKPNNPQSTDSVAAALQNNLLANHNGLQNFSVLKQADNLAASNSILNLLTNLVSGIAAISLLVGGIGIMNVTLVGVTERTREIGVRKAIGATNQQILNQFLTEAVMLSIFGGIIGIILSLVINGALRFTTSLEPIISWQVILLAAGVSLAVGVIFGIIPAIKAARKDPIEALRYQ